MDDVEAFIAHYGKKGMKWGKTTSRAERKEEKLQDRVDKGNAILEKNRGSGTRSAVTILGKDFVTKMGLNVAGMAVMKVSSSPTTQSGAIAAANILSIGTTVKTVNDLINVRAAVVNRRDNA